MMPGGLEWVIVLLLGLVVVIAVIRRPRLVLIPLAVVGVFGVLAVAALFTVRVSVQKANDSRVAEVIPHSALLASDDVVVGRPVDTSQWKGAAWDPDITRRFLADKYPSAPSAATGLTHHLVRTWKEQTGSNAIPARVKVCGFSATGVLAAIDAAVREEWPGVPVEISPQTSEPVTAERVATTLPAGDEAVAQATVVLEAQVLATVSDDLGPPVRWGSLQVVLNPATHRLSAVGEWSDKPWLDDLPAYRSKLAASGERLDLLVGYSQGLAATPVEAHRGAVASAAQLLRTELARRVPGAVVPDAAALEVYAQRGLRDEFVQLLRRPYGDVYRAAVLVSVSPDMLATQRMGDVRGTLARLVGLLLLTVLVYLFLNAATKGYYVWSVRLVAVAVAVVGLGLVLISA